MSHFISRKSARRGTRHLSGVALSALLGAAALAQGSAPPPSPPLRSSASASTPQRQLSDSLKTQTINFSADRRVAVTFEEFGSGRPVLLLHGGAGPQSMLGFAQLLAAREHAHVYVPTHPGFGGTPRPDWLNSPADLATVYLDFLNQLDLHDVTVVGNSLGGWVAAEMAIQNSPRISSFVLVDALGITVDHHPVADVSTLTLPEIIKLSYANPALAVLPDFTTLTEAQRSVLAANRAALRIYAGPTTSVPTLMPRLKRIRTPTLLTWGDSDGIVDPEYGRAYSAAIPAAEFQLLPHSGHTPQLETPDQLLTVLWDFSQRHVVQPPAAPSP